LRLRNGTKDEGKQKIIPDLPHYSTWKSAPPLRYGTKDERNQKNIPDLPHYSMETQQCRSEGKSNQPFDNLTAGVILTYCSMVSFILVSSSSPDLRQVSPLSDKQPSFQ
jgi:hypothetical protein